MSNRRSGKQKTNITQGTVLVSVLVLLSNSCVRRWNSTVEEKPGLPNIRLERIDSKPAIEGEWQLNNTEFSGTLRLADLCRKREETPVQSIAHNTSSANVPVSLLYLGLGAAAIGAGSYLAITSSQKSDNVQCDINNVSSCGNKSPQDEQRQNGASLVLLGAIPAAFGIYGLASGTQTSQRVIKTEIRQKTSDLGACLSEGDLAGINLELVLPGMQPVQAKVDGMRVTATLPEEPNGTLTATEGAVVVRSAPKAGSHLPEGTAIGTFSLTSYKAAIEKRRKSKLAENDRYDFDGAIHGDAEAKQSFTFACTPTGADKCFDAIDNDCDGQYDVGCGYQNGALQWTLAWHTGDDLDLHIIGPDNAHVYFQNKKGKSAGLVLDVDCLGSFGNNCLAENIENIYSPQEKKPMEGTYRGWVEVYRTVPNDDSQATIEAMVGGRLAGRTFRMPLKLPAYRGQRVFFAFAVGKDRDGDSVIDREDACPDVSGIFSAVPAERGCPDTDHDGIADIADACNDKPGVRSADPKTNGCPETIGRARLTSRGVEIDGTIEFTVGSAVLETRSLALLHDIATVMKKYPQALEILAIDGHTDNQGDRNKNYSLSRDRVKAVYQHLITKENISSARLRTRWYGPDKPVASNDSDTGRSKNRRVEFVVVSPTPSETLNW